MTPEKNGTKHLLWIAGGIAVCVGVSVFFFGLNRTLACTEHDVIEDKCKLRYMAVEQKFEQIMDVLHEVREDVKYHLKEKK